MRQKSLEFQNIKRLGPAKIFILFFFFFLTFQLISHIIKVIFRYYFHCSNPPWISLKYLNGPEPQIFKYHFVMLYEHRVLFSRAGFSSIWVNKLLVQDLEWELNGVTHLLLAQNRRCVTNVAWNHSPLN